MASDRQRIEQRKREVAEKLRDLTNPQVDLAFHMRNSTYTFLLVAELVETCNLSAWKKAKASLNKKEGKWQRKPKV
jgi:hypothetical protein